MENSLTVLWSTKTRYWDEIVEALANQGIKTIEDKKTWTIQVDKKDYGYAYAILCELNNEGGFGW